MSNDPNYQRLIHTQQWLRLRRNALTLHPCCQECEAKGLVTPAVEVHHITPVECGTNLAEMERLMFNPANLRCLCHACHVEAHIALGRSGKKQAKMINAEHRARVIERFYGDKAEGGGVF